MDLLDGHSWDGLSPWGGAGLISLAGMGVYLAFAVGFQAALSASDACMRSSAPCIIETTTVLGVIPIRTIAPSSETSPSASSPALSVDPVQAAKQRESDQRHGIAQYFANRKDCTQAARWDKSVPCVGR